MIRDKLTEAWLDFIEAQREEQNAAVVLCEVVESKVSQYRSAVGKRERIKGSLDKLLEPLKSRKAALDDLRSQAPEPQPSETGMTPTIQARAVALLDLFDRGVS